MIAEWIVPKFGAMTKLKLEHLLLFFISIQLFGVKLLQHRGEYCLLWKFAHLLFYF